jgi:hypothetical protein
MKGSHNDQGLESIAALIRQEEEEALAFYRSGNFREGLERRLEEGADGYQPDFPSRPRLVPVLTGILAVAVAGILLLVLKGPRTAPPPEFKALASALGRLPGFSNLPRRDGMEFQGPTKTSRFADSVRRTLASAEEAKREKEQELAVPAGPIKVPRLSLDQKMEILFKERAIERALLLFKESSKEV